MHLRGKNRGTHTCYAHQGNKDLRWSIIVVFRNRGSGQVPIHLHALSEHTASMHNATLKMFVQDVAEWPWIKSYTWRRYVGDLAILLSWVWHDAEVT